MVVVVVVVVAMSQKGKKIGAVKQTLGIAEDKPKRVSPNIAPTNLDVEHGKSYLIELGIDRGQKGIEHVTEFTARTSNGKGRIHIPKSVVEGHDIIEPGRTIQATVFEVNKSDQDFVDNSKVLDRATVVEDTSISDDCDARIKAHTAYEYLDDKEKLLKFRNVDKNQEVTAMSNQNVPDGDISFTIGARKAINASPGDLIEVIKTETESDKDSQELIEEMHEMITEMYNAYLEQT